eukprot:c28771_g1_i1 orf=974-4189(+)
MATMLRQSLRGLCCKTGWCYAVFWKLKRRSRMVLTWEDGYYEFKKPSVISNLSSIQMAPNSLLVGGNGCLETEGNPLGQRVRGQEGSCLEEQIGLAVAKMSYQVYALGEGIIGRVAFTGKHQWVYGNEERSNVGEVNCGSSLYNRNVLEKYPAGWQTQFMAGIKTIAVIAVPHGVVQLGSTQLITENLEWVDHIRSVFSTLQGVPGTLLSDLVSDGQGRKEHPNITIMPMGSASMGRPEIVQRMLPTQGSTNFVTGGVPYSLGYTPLGRISLNGSSADLQAIPPFTELPNPTKMVVQQSTLHQGCDDLESPKGLGADAGLMTLGCSPMPAVMNSLQSDIPVSGNLKLHMLKTNMGSDSLTDVGQGPCKESYIPEEQLVSQSKINTDLKPQIHLDALMCIQNSLFAKENQQPANDIAKPASVEFAMTSDDGPLRTNAINGVQLLSTPHVNAQGVVPSFHGNGAHQNHPCQSDDPFQDQLSSQVERMLTTQPLRQNSCLQTCKPSLAQTIVKRQKSIGEVGQFITSSCNTSADPSNSNCLEGVVKSPIVQAFVCSDDSSLEQKIMDTKGLDKVMSKSALQSMVKGLGQAKTVAQELDSTYNGLLDNVGYNCIDSVGFDNLASFTTRQDRSWNCCFAIGDELSQALGPAFKKGHDKDFWEDIFSQSNSEPMKDNFDQNIPGISGCSTNWAGTTVAHSLVSSTGEDVISNGAVGGSYLSESKQEPLLEAVIGASSISQCTTHSADESFSCKATFLGINSGLPALKSVNKGDPAPEYLNIDIDHICPTDMQKAHRQEDMGKLHNIRLVSDPHSRSTLQRPLKCSSTKAILNSWIEEGQSMKSETMQSPQVKNLEDNTKISRKRARPGESTRPRPKDRQQIQDRVRELREIVPNGSKCSIDALLERTIKHMLFLQSVTQHADKLKQSGELKVSESESSLLPQAKVESGTSFALELGVHGMGCPIIVENLSQPRQMLVEMICEEREHFLEIADIIRKLDLTILKGIMESRADKVWARFVVEANRDVYRVEILWSLMQRLQTTTKNSSSVTCQAGTTRPQSMDSSPQAFVVSNKHLLRP